MIFLRRAVLRLNSNAREGFLLVAPHVFLTLNLLISVILFVFVVGRENGFRTALDLYKNNKGRPRGSKKLNVVLLYYRTWIIEYDGSGFPAGIFNLRKKASEMVKIIKNHYGGVFFESHGD